MLVIIQLFYSALVECRMSYEYGSLYSLNIAYAKTRFSYI